MMLALRVLLPATLALALAGVPQGGRWRVTNPGSAVLVAVDTTRIAIETRNGRTSLRVWTKWTFPEPRPNPKGGRPYVIMLSDDVIQCSPTQTFGAEAVYQDKTGQVVMRDGGQISADVRLVFRQPVPESVGEIAYGKICDWYGGVLHLSR